MGSLEVVQVCAVQLGQLGLQARHLQGRGREVIGG
jgi:hypothetical protein